MINQLSSLIREVAKQEVMSRFLNVGSCKKKDGSLLSEADLAAQKALSLGLPDVINAPVLGEEMTSEEQKTLWHQHKNSGLWVIDPIDGTTNFINGIPHFALSIAFIENARPQIGAIFNPISLEFFHAQRGQGAFLNDTPLPLKQHVNHLSESILGVDTKYLWPGKLVSRLQTVCPCASQRNMGCSTLDWCFLAAGRYDLYLHGGQKLWDYAAGSLILEEAGGQVATLEEDDLWSGLHTWKRSVIAGLQPELFRSWTRWVRQNQ
ncbi:inositol monophosphatase family protein [Neisseria sp. Ec49-e6-T10]|uniref:inositol monophosphatase family protein n=1 Tax=Neisseria sp. Ec49-e6-T10 TaxID=3140744 RepID=UPI003EB7E462